MGPETSDNMPLPDGLTIYFWQEEHDAEDAGMWWLDDLPWPTEEP